MVDAEQFSKNTHVDDVGDEFCDFGVDLPGQGAHWNRVGHNIVSFHGHPFRVAVPDDDGTRLKGCEVLVPCCWIDENLDVGSVAGCLVAFVREANDVPCWEARNVGRKEVLPAHGDAHFKERLQENEVGGLRPRSVRSSDVDGEVVDDGAHTKHPLFRNGRCVLIGWGSHAPFQHVAPPFTPLRSAGASG